MTASAVCHRCERLRNAGGVWVIVELYGAYACRWEFCSIECLGSHFEAQADLPLAGVEWRDGEGGA
jgi:hypothetical protein